MTATDIALLLFLLVVLSVWIPFVVWVSVTAGVSAFVCAMKRSAQNLNREKIRGHRKVEES